MIANIWPIVIVLGILVGIIFSETAHVKEGFAVPLRTDIGKLTHGFTEESGYNRDLRYTETFTDIQGNGIAADFCRAVSKNGDPSSLRIACALATHEGMDTMEFQGPSVKEGFQLSRDDYWKDVNGKGRMFYCRILKEKQCEEGAELSDKSNTSWFAGCAVATSTGITQREIRDVSPPPHIRSLLEAFEDAMVWYRWRDDSIDYIENTELELHGHPEFPSLLHPIKTRGLQLNRWPRASQEAGETAPPLRDFLRWGEKETLCLDQIVNPQQIRAISFWVYLDHLEKQTRILECTNGGTRDLVWIGIEGGGASIEPFSQPKGDVLPADELGSAQIHALGAHVEPPKQSKKETSTNSTTTGSWVFEMWDKEQRIMRITTPPIAKTDVWQHVALTTTDSTSWWPTWQIWLDGQCISEKKDGRMIPALQLTQNKIGKNVRGCLQDFRIYRAPLPPSKIASMIAWSSSSENTILHPQP
jgi:hypothetical protein